MSDWLDLEESDNWLAIAEPPKEEEDLTATELMEILPSMPSDLALPADQQERKKALREAWNRLKPKQQGVLLALPKAKFSMRKAVRDLKGTIDEVSGRTVDTWMATNKDFKVLVRALRGLASEEATHPDRLHLMTDEIAEAALKGEEILFNGAPTGYKKKHFGDALRAIELQMRSKKMFGNEEGKNNGFVGPGIVIQVIQTDGGIKDVTPGVVIDLPAPEESVGA